MSRSKKKRSNANQLIFEDETGPNKSERFANPDSYEARKKRAMKDRKKNRSVYQKELDKQEAAKAGGDQGRPKGGRLADKIRKMNADKKAD